MAVMKFRHFSDVLKTPMECNIVTPDNLKDTLYKVVWLCHGGSGSHNEWLYHVDLCSMAEQYKVCFVVVNANDSCFVDMPYGLKYGTYLGCELPKLIWESFKFLSHKREDNYIVGLSNGGYGCLYLALTYPENYMAVGAFSAGDKADAVPKPFEEGEMNPRVRMFGQVDIKDTDFSIKYLAKKLANAESVKPRIYHVCGGKDPWLLMNLMVKECFEEINNTEYDYEYHQIDDLGHEWGFWAIELENFLKNKL